MLNSEHIYNTDLEGGVKGLLGKSPAAVVPSPGTLEQTEVEMDSAPALCLSPLNVKDGLNVSL